MMTIEIDENEIPNTQKLLAEQQALIETQEENIQMLKRNLNELQKFVQMLIRKVEYYKQKEKER